MQAQVTLDSSNRRLVEGFQWAKAQALAYVFEGDPVGDWYEAALPGREAFCMRDVAHQSMGAQVLGLSRHTHNMLHKFAANIADARDWCSFWEIDRYDRPCPVDYRDDRDFWYNLPANFDVLHCCYRQYLWTGDRRYLDDPVFRTFYAATVNDYVRRWDRDGDGIPEHYAPYGRRGIASYNEAVERPLVGADLIAAQYAAYLAYADLLASMGGDAAADGWRAKADQLRVLYESQWWFEEKQRFASVRRHNQQLDTHFRAIASFLPLYFGLVKDSRKVDAALSDVIAHRRELGIEDRSYLPELFYAYGRPALAYAELAEQLAPNYPRREYPEVSYAVIGSIAAGMMGIAPDATTRTVATLAQLDEQTAWVELDGVPVFGNVLCVRHEGNTQSVLTHQAGRPLRWQARFAGHQPHPAVDGRPAVAHHGWTAYGQPVTWVTVDVESGSRHVANSQR